MARYFVAALVVLTVLLGIWRGPAMQPGPISDEFEPQMSIDAAATADSALLDEVTTLSSKRALALQTCNGELDEPSMAQLRAEWERRHADAWRVLKDSADAEHLLVAALASRKTRPNAALDLLDRAAAIEPRNPLIASQRLAFCQNVAICERAPLELERQLIVADKGNGIAWVQVARSRLHHLDERGALAAMREGASAAAIDDYFVDYIKLFERGLAASSDLSAAERFGSAFGFSAMVFSTTAGVVSDCQERAKSSAEWRDVCLRLGERFEYNGQSMMTTQLGMSMQAMMYEYGGDTRAEQIVQRRQEQHRDKYYALARQSAAAENWGDAKLIRHYVEILETSGEFAALEFLAAEAEARLPEGQDPACETP